MHVEKGIGETGLRKIKSSDNNQSTSPRYSTIAIPKIKSGGTFKSVRQS